MCSCTHAQVPARIHAFGHICACTHTRMNVCARRHACLPGVVLHHSAEESVDAKMFAYGHICM